MPYRHAYDSIPAQVWTADPQGLLNYVNAVTEAYMGVPAEDLHGTGWGDAVHPQDLAAALPRWQHCVATGDPYEQLFRLRRGSDQRYRWFLARANAVRDADGAINHWVGVNTQIDGIAMAHEIGRVVLDANSLREGVFEQLPVAMVVLSGAGLRVQRATAAARRFAALPQVERQPLSAAYPALAALCESGVFGEALVLGEGRRIADVALAPGVRCDVLCEPLHDAHGRVDGLSLAFLTA